MSQINQKLNKLLSLINNQYFVLKYYHWNYEGNNFYPYHLLFDEYASKVFSSIDEVAERIRQLDGKVDLLSLTVFDKASNIELVDSNLHNLSSIIKFLLTLSEEIITDMEEIIKITGENSDYSTADILTKYLEDQQKYQWFLKSSLN